MSAAVRWRLRVMRSGDHSEVLALWRACDGIGLSAADGRGAVAAYLRRNSGMSFVAVARGRIVGAVLCGHDGRRGYLHHLAVRKRWRRRGIGAALVEAALARLHAARIQKCNLFLFDDNEPGRAFWEGRGWTARRDLVLLQKPLA
jgi:ribosomal protein S18 acetylase RimI-like enzyme